MKLLDAYRKQLNAYSLIKVTADNIKDAYLLIKGNTEFLSLQNEETTLEDCLADIESVPPTKKLEDKYYYGIYKNDKLLALVDYIEGYPTPSTIYLGFFILDPSYHEKGLGTSLMEPFIKEAQGCGFKSMELGCYVDNKKGYRFWTKLGFKEIDIVDVSGIQTAKMKKEL